MTDATVELAKGLAIDDFTVYAKKVTAGRFIEEANLEIYIRRGSDEAFLLMAKIFFGRKPHYSPWVELFSINNRPELEKDILFYFDSAYEDHLLGFFSRFLDPAGRIFIEYYADIETANGLRSGFPPAITRLGFKLFERGFTWFKDWYFPEGLMEGGQKLQGEKPPDSGSRSRQLTQIMEEIKSFLEKMAFSGEPDQYEKNALERAKKILGM